MNESDVENLITLYGNSLYKFCYKLTLTKSDAEDLYQQTFLKALEIKITINEEQHPKAFLMSLAISQWKNNRRKYARRQRIAPTISMEDSSYDIPASDMNLEENYLEQALKEAVQLIIYNLPDKFKLPIMLYYTEELSLTEIAKLLKVPEGTLKSRLHKGRLLIKKELEVKGYGTYN